VEGLTVNQIVASSLDYERARVEFAMLRLSMVDVSFSSAADARLFANNSQSNFNSMNTQNDTLYKEIEVIQSHDPANAKADVDGNVYFVKIDPTKEMATLISATRAYEANTRAYNASSQMTRTALDLGSK